MSALSLRLPESIHQKLGELAQKEGISINQFINSAVAEKLAALMTEEYLRERGRRASAAGFDAVLAKIPDEPPIPGDELPEGYKRRTRRRKRANSKLAPVGRARGARPTRSTTQR